MRGVRIGASRALRAERLMPRRFSRRDILRAAAWVGGSALAAPMAELRGQDLTAGLPDRVDFRRLVAANRILAHENVVDAFGHVSIRDPRDPERYVMARSRSPELVELGDLMEFELDGTPVDARGRTPYGERMIHGAIYEARADVNAVVHNHSRAVLPFTISGVPLRPMIHTAAVIGREIPVWDSRDDFGDTDMLVRRMDQGRSLVKTLGGNTCLLMRGHGAVVAARDVKEAVMTAVYLQVNAEVQLQALGLGEPKALSSAEVALAAETQVSPLALDRVWEYFCMRAGVEPI
jgi:HCOMODA/2-hydroxy-3-carboxy-muconic semialdehyde decarboxylase